MARCLDDPYERDALFAGAEFDDAIGSGVGFHGRVLVVDLLIVELRTAAAHEAAGFTVAGGEAGAMEQGPHRHPRAEVRGGNLDRRQIVADAALLERAACRLCGFFGGGAAVQERGRFEGEHFLGVVDLSPGERFQLGDLVGLAPQMAAAVPLPAAGLMLLGGLGGLGALRRRTVFDSRQAAIDSWRGRGAFATWPEELLVDYAADGLIDQPDGTVRLACAGAWEASSYMAQGQDGVAILLAARHPVLAYRAERHSTCTVAPDDPRLATNPLVRVVEVEGPSHFLPMERPDLVRASLTQAAKA